MSATATGLHAIAQGLHDGVAKAVKNGAHPFRLPPLPYALDALEPYIDAHTMQTHHDGHHAAYVTNLNKAIGQDIEYYAAWEGTLRTDLSTATNEWLRVMMRDLSSVPEKIRSAIRDNGGGHYNHSLFWQMMKKNGGGEPKGELVEAINKNFGSFGGFKAQFSKAAISQSGDGWAWLTLDGKSLRIETTANEDTPLSVGREVLLGIDFWEHAYHLKYPNKRADYVAAWFNVINWDFIAERYARLRR